MSLIEINYYYQRIRGRNVN